MTVKNIFSAATFFLLFIAVVLPNSLQAITFATMLFCALLALPLINLKRSLIIIFKYYAASVIVTFLYIIIGIINGAPGEAVKQVIIIYIVSPLLWIIIFAGLVSNHSEKTLIKWFVIYSLFAIFSVGLFFYLYLNFGSSSVTFFKEGANLNLTDGYAGATMFVYGSLIFLSGGFFASPDIIKNVYLRTFLFIGFLISAITSGRSALILSIIIGIIIGIIFSPNYLYFNDHRKSMFKKRNLLLISFFGVVFILPFILNLFAISIDAIFRDFFDKLASGGGVLRSEQFYALLKGINDSFGFGVGHGVGVSYLRDNNFPWRYELVWMATILRVGFFGSLIYLMLFLIYIRKFLIYRKKNNISAFDLFIFSGFVAAFVASNTNPYIESFAFQWMYVFPVVSLLLRRPV